MKMAENKMEEVAELLGVELGMPFNIKGMKKNNPFVLQSDGLSNSNGIRCCSVLFLLLTGDHEIEQPILDDIEKRYLEGVLRPFKDRVRFIVKEKDNNNFEYIIISVGLETIAFPVFEKGMMYKGMKTGKRYSVKELGLFE